MSDYLTMVEAAGLAQCSPENVRLHARAGHLGAMIRPGQRNAPILLLRTNVELAIEQGILRGGPTPPAIVELDAAWLADAGENADDVAARLGYSGFAPLAVVLLRRGRRDIVERLTSNSRRHGVTLDGRLEVSAQ